MTTIIPLDQMQQKTKHIQTQQQVLDSFDAPTPNCFTEHVWQFSMVTASGEKQTFTMDFRFLTVLENQFKEWADAFAPLGLLTQAKTLCLASISPKNTYTSFRNKYTLVCHLYHALAQQGSHYLSRNDYDDFLEQLLMHHWTNGIPEKRLSPISYSYISVQLPLLSKLSKLCVMHDCLDIAKPLSFRATEKVLKTVLERISGGELTLEDYKQGGTFNHLTLDHGKYYAEYCNDFFSAHVSKATAINRTLAEYESDSLDKKKCLAALLVGDTNYTLRKYSQAYQDKLRIEVQQKFENHYLPLAQRDHLLTEVGVQAVAEHLSIDIEYQRHHLDCLRFLIAQRVWLHDDIHLDKLFIGDFSQLTLKHLDAAISSVKSAYHIDTSLPTPTYYQQLGVERTRSRTFTQRYYHAVRDAGITAFLSLNGWRRSELGFAVDNIQLKANTDILDQAAFPYRCVVDWHVFKTNGDTLTKREITTSSYFLVRMAAELNGQGDYATALHVGIKGSHKNSSNFVQRAVSTNWERFIDHYPPFVQLEQSDELEKLKTSMSQGAVLTVEEKKQFEYLSTVAIEENWQVIASDHALRNTRDLLRDQRERVCFFLATDERKDNKVLHHYRAYLKGGEYDLPSETITLLDKYLDEEMKVFLAEVETVSKQVSDQIYSMFIEGCIYPTPHSFRHMWAEAVYRRFDGDAGWFIRSQFKHITPTMWLAYIRGKGCEAILEKAQFDVKSSLLNNWLRHEGQDHAGRFSVYLERLVKHTHITTKDKLDNLLDKMARIEIQDIKANPWGFCLLRRRNHELAKCAEFGQPQRDNAEPKLCLDCIHSLTKSSHVDYIIWSVEQHVSLLQTPERQAMSSAFNSAIVESRQYVNTVLKHIRKLAPDHEYITQMELAVHLTRNIA